MNETAERPEMQALAFLLGEWQGTTMVYAKDGSGSAQEGRIRGAIRPVLSGAWYEWNYVHQPDITSPLERTARYSFGWNEGAKSLIAIYVDDRGNAMLEHAVGGGWSDGQLAFQGVMHMPGMGAVGFADVFTADGAGRFRNTVTMTVGDKSHLHGIMDCWRL